MIGLIEQACSEESALSISRACKALSLSRSTLYRHRSCESADVDIELRDKIQKIALEMPRYGYRRMTKELQRQGNKINHKRVLRLMRQDNLLCLRRKSFVATTDSNHAQPIYRNLAKKMVLGGINELWVADITYIRLHREFVYLAVILDAFSRVCIGWNLARRLSEKLAIGALEVALASREFQAGLVHHSDRGVQYASGKYTDLLKERGISISMSRAGNPYDNAKAESFMKTLKYEEVYLWEYENYADALDRIGYFIDEVYNKKRLHSSIGYIPPIEFEQLNLTQKVAMLP